MIQLMLIFGFFSCLCDGSVFFRLVLGDKIVGSIGAEGLSGRFLSFRFGLAFFSNVSLAWDEIEKIRLRVLQDRLTRPPAIA